VVAASPDQEQSLVILLRAVMADFLDHDIANLGE
jgi:hypothetical protein